MRQGKGGRGGTNTTSRRKRRERRRQKTSVREDHGVRGRKILKTVLLGKKGSIISSCWNTGRGVGWQRFMIAWELKLDWRGNFFNVPPSSRERERERALR